MLRQFHTYRNPPAVYNDAWEFRKVCRVGSVLANAFSLGDVDGDGVEEVLLGTSEGHLVVLKSGLREPLFLRDVNGTISLVVWEPQSKLLVVVCMEGKAAVIQGCCGPPDQCLVNHMVIPANCTSGVVVGDRLMLGSSDRRIYMYDLQLKRQIGALFLQSQIFSIGHIALCEHPIVLVGSTLELSLVDAAAPERWDDTSVLWKWQVDRGSGTGTPQASPAAVETVRLPMAVAAEVLNGIATIVVATEDGCATMFRVFEETRDVASASKAQFTFNIGDRRVLIHRLWDVRLEALIPRVLCLRFGREVCAVCVTVSGALLVVDGNRNAVVSRVKPEMCSVAAPTAGHGRGRGGNGGDAKPSAAVVFTATIDEIAELDIPLLTLGSPGWVACERRVAYSPLALVSAHSGSGRTVAPMAGAARGIKAALQLPWSSDALHSSDDARGRPLDDEAIVTIGRALFPDADPDDAVLLRRLVLRLCTRGYSNLEWTALQLSAATASRSAADDARGNATDE